MESPMNQSGKPFPVGPGASSGIGLDLTRQFAEHGYHPLIGLIDPLVRNRKWLDSATMLGRSASGAYLQEVQGTRIV